MTDKIKLSELETGKFITLSKVTPTGSLAARKDNNGAIFFYWRYKHDSKSERIKIGLYDSSLPPRSTTPGKNGMFSILAAEIQASELATRHINNISQGGDGFAAIQAQAKVDKAQKKKELLERNAHTFERLYHMYSETLINPKTRADVDCIYRNHIETKHQTLAQKSASTITDEDWADVLREVANKTPRTANKLRSYMMAAYNMALYARTSSEIPVAFKGFKVTSNPIATIKPNSLGNRADKNPLSLEDMRRYWSSIKELAGIKGAILRIHLLSGGLRALQLLRLTHQDLSEHSFTLYDAKGKKAEPTKYTTPITALMNADFEQLKISNPDGFLFSTTGGTIAISQETLLRWAQDAVGDTIENFQIKRIRSGVETLLASRGVGIEIRGRLQSHGVTGVQAKHYDGHDYIKEKAQALAILEFTLTQADGDNLIRLHA